MSEEITIAAPGADLSGRLFAPQSAARRAIVLHSATGVPQGYYRGFADWLSEAYQAVVLSYDYRDFGASGGARPLRESRADMVDWGLHDQAAAQEALEARYPGLPVWAVGHSLGGLMLGFQPGAARLERAITIASGPNHISDHPWWYLPAALSFWYGIGPLATRLRGYLPGRALGLGADLPAGVYWQWRRWCLTRGFFQGEIGAALPPPQALRLPMRMVAIGDDPMIPPGTVRRMAGLYPAAQMDLVTLQPKDFGLKRVGHIGALARRNAALWPALMG